MGFGVLAKHQIVTIDDQGRYTGKFCRLHQLIAAFGFAGDAESVESIVELLFINALGGNPFLDALLVDQAQPLVVQSLENGMVKPLYFANGLQRVIETRHELIERIAEADGNALEFDVGGQFFQPGRKLPVKLLAMSTSE